MLPALQNILDEQKLLMYCNDGVDLLEESKKISQFHVPADPS